MTHVRSHIDLVDKTPENVGHPSVDAFDVFPLSRREPDGAPGRINFYRVPGRADLGQQRSQFNGILRPRKQACSWGNGGIPFR